MNQFLKIFFILSIINFNQIINAQDLMILCPYQLGLSTSTARVGDLNYAQSALAQAYFHHKTAASLSLYNPYQQLTDGKLQTNAAQIFCPSFNWGSVNFSYGNFNASNFDQNVFSKSIIKLGYTNALLKKFIFASYSNP